jgi:spermidine synthase
MSLARVLPVFCYGLFTLAVQTLLFRDFLTSFEGGDISVGLFFGSWFLWIAAGACLTRRETPFARMLLRRLEYVLLGYLPAVAVQSFLIVHARPLAGVPAYLLLPLSTVVPLSLAVNAPAGFMTGLLFPLLCRWVRRSLPSLPVQRVHPIHQPRTAPVAQVYRLEAVGSLVGGVGTTLLLGGGLAPARLFLLLAALMAFAAAVVRHSRTRRWWWLLLPGCLLVALAGGVDRPLSHRLQEAKWERLLPGETFGGSFQTAQAEYLYGLYREQWVVLRDGGTCEALPDTGGNGRIAAIGLSQHPGAKQILVIGSGLGLCQALLTLETVEEVTWAQGDNDYMRRIGPLVPPAFQTPNPRLRLLEGDLRARLAAEGPRYDLVILNQPDATSAVLNRYYTLEGYRLIRAALRPGGVLAARVSGGANRMGTERILLGASMRATLRQVFPDLVLVPGDESWFLAAEPGRLSGDPAVLQARLAALAGAAALFPPEALHTVYLPERAASALAHYSRTAFPERLLVNRDARPLAYLYSLLLSARQAGVRGTPFMTSLALSGPLVLLAPFLVLALLRPLYTARTPPSARAPAFDHAWLVFSSGAAGIGTVIVLMHAYQTRLGSLYLHVGLLSSLFMAGLAAGAAVISGLLARTTFKGRPSILRGAVILLHVGLLAAMGCWPAAAWHGHTFAAAFLLSGLCAGGYFPLAAGALAEVGFEAGRSGGRLETADHLGAAAGSLLTGLLLLPLLGTRATLAAIALLLLANLPSAAVARTPERERAGATGATAMRLRRLGYLLAGLGLTALLCRWQWAVPNSAAAARAPANATHPTPVAATVPPAAPPHDETATAAPPGDLSWHAGLEDDAADAPATGDAQTVDLPRIRALIRQGRLSNREADFYRKVETPE